MKNSSFFAQNTLYKHTTKDKTLSHEKINIFFLNWTPYYKALVHFISGYGFYSFAQQTCILATVVDADLQWKIFRGKHINHILFVTRTASYGILGIPKTQLMLAYSHYYLSLYWGSKRGLLPSFRAFGSVSGPNTQTNTLFVNIYQYDLEAIREWFDDWKAPKFLNPLGLLGV